MINVQQFPPTPSDNHLIHYPNVKTPLCPPYLPPPQVDPPISPPSPPPNTFYPSNQLINVSFLNVRSLRNKSSEIRDYVINNNLHVFCMVETWLSEGDTSVIASFLPDTYVFHPDVMAEVAV